MINFPNSPAINDIFTSGSSSWKWDGVKWVPLSGSANLKGDGVNILRRNGGFEVWQRGAGGSASIAIAASASPPPYTADGWYLLNGANQASVVSQVAGLINGSAFAAKVQRNSGQTGVTAMRLGFPLDTDELWPMLGQFVRLSVVIKAGANWSPASGNLTARLAVGTGVPVKLSTGYTGSADAISAVQAITATATQYQFNSAAVVPVTARQAEVCIEWTPVGTAGADDSFTIDDVQLEIVPAATGYVASPFQRLNFEEQLLLCQRHYWKSYNYGVAPGTTGAYQNYITFSQSVGASTAQYATVRTPIKMRGVPTCIVYSPADTSGQIRNNSASTNWSSTSVLTAYENDIAITGVSPDGTAAGYLSSYQLVADAGI